jgi:hypothetical protein
MLTEPGNRKWLGRQTYQPNLKALTNAAAVALFTVPCPALGTVGGQIVGLVTAANSSDIQSASFVCSYSISAKANVLTMNVATSQAISNALGTMVATIAVTDAGFNVANVAITASSGMANTGAPLILQVEYLVIPIKGIVTYL